MNGRRYGLSQGPAQDIQTLASSVDMPLRSDIGIDAFVLVH